MAPRRQSWPHEEKPSTASDSNSNSLALVLEDYEVFEAETAELSVEEVDGFSSLLLDMEHPTTNGHEACELITLVTRNFHPVHSAHSLATTSIVTPAQHAHTAEYKLSANTSSKQPSSSYMNGRASGINGDPDGLKHYETPFLPVHLLTAVSLCGQSRSPVSWPERLLAYTDAPAFVNAVGADLAKVCSRLGKPGSVQVTPCDQAPEWTTCHLTCCQAGIEWLAARLPTAVPSSTCTQVDNSTSTYSFERKRSHPDIEWIPIQIRSHVLELPAVLSAGLCAFSGLRPEALCISSSFTAVYLLLVTDENHAVSSPPQAIDSGSQVAYFPSARSTIRCPESSVVWAMLVSLVPWFESPTTSIDLPNTRLLPTGCDNAMLQTWPRTEQHLVALAVLVDVIKETDENGSPVFRAIIHQRLHHLPEISVCLESSQ